MSHRTKFCLVSLLLGLLAFAGCTSDETALLEPSQSSDSTDLYTNLYADVSQVMQDHGVSLPTVLPGEKYTPLPSLMLVANAASAAKDAITNATYWEPLTTFVTGVKKYEGYEIGWLENVPEDPDPDSFNCYYFMDIPENNPRRPTEVDPYTDAIDDTLDRVTDILTNHPELATDRVYVSDGVFAYYYEFTYPVGDSFNNFKMYMVYPVLVGD